MKMEKTANLVDFQRFLLLVFGLTLANNRGSRKKETDMPITKPPKLAKVQGGETKTKKPRNRWSSEQLEEFCKVVGELAKAGDVIIDDIIARAAESSILSPLNLNPANVKSRFNSLRAQKIDTPPLLTKPRVDLNKLQRLLGGQPGNPTT